jgi:tetratricopeptide (TPR) repeat protein
MRNLGVRNLGLAIAATVALGSSLVLPAAPAAAQEILQEQGSLRPMEDEYTFSGQAGQTVVISMSSPEFDTVVHLFDASDREIGMNDDYGRSLNSTLIVTLPQTGTYKIRARSFSGVGGNYSVSVRPATAYDQAYNRGYTAFREGNTEEALAAYNEAIRLDPSQPTAYADRADLRYSQGAATTEFLADYERAAELYQQAGNTEMAENMRSQIQYIQNPPEEMPEEMPEEEMPR